MTVTRRDFLRLAGLVASGATLAACSPVYSQLAEIAGGSMPPFGISASEFRILRRLTYGPGTFERKQIAQNGLAGWIEDQLTPENVDDESLVWRLRPFDFLKQDADSLSILDKEELTAGFKQATLLRKLYSRRQLHEIMVEFWTDHFNIAIAKGDCWFLKVVDDREVIRAHALGNFQDLLWASAHSPAMLVYLDNQANHRDAPNENYARELLELHTLGVNGGYGQDDVMSLAQCLTGWTVKEHFWRGQFTFDPDRHYPGQKSVLGQAVESAGIAAGEQILRHLALHPATAKHLATKLVRRFVADDPLSSHQPLVNQAADTFLQTRGDIKATLSTILFDGLLSSTQSTQPKYTRPLDYLAASLRAVEASSDGGPPLQDYLARMGQAFYEWPTPDGPPDHVQAWMGNLMPRWQFAMALGRNEIPGTNYKIEDLLTHPDDLSADKLVDTLSTTLLGSPLEAEARTSLLTALEGATRGQEIDMPGVLLTGLLASPAYQWR
jgi:hypothetical protein